ncbi:hypothetical protein FN846DRAFT_912596 [Sphaerosporella brunnea]|uniref:non-specific serine/threonine protein kinase n=1 Tax=Sphaerosporella brunnea TaxID=1250544 RepID=A0A5J5EG68_9PEZI|nr:hypothetical protein FN846DRAFT_912596 [Sphaerosporella brunnea]
MAATVADDPAALAEQHLDRLCEDFAHLFPAGMDMADTSQRKTLRMFLETATKPDTQQLVTDLTRLIAAAEIELPATREKLQAKDELVAAIKEAVMADKKQIRTLETRCTALDSANRQQETEMKKLREKPRALRENLDAQGRTPAIPPGACKPIHPMRSANAWKPFIDPAWILLEEQLAVIAACPQARDISEKTFTTTHALYESIVAMLKLTLPSCEVFDNGADQQLEISITTAGVNVAHPLYVRTVLELKEGEIGIKDKRQLVEKLCQLAEPQYWRLLFTGLLLNTATKEAYVLQLRRSKSMSQIFSVQQYTPISFEQAVTYIRDVVTISDAERPCTPPFSPVLGKIQRQLGMTPRSVIAEFVMPEPSAAVGWIEGVQIVPEEDDTVCVKRAYCADHTLYPIRACEDDITILKKIHDLGGHDSLVRILFHDDDMLEYGMLPCGVPADPDDLNGWPTRARCVLNDVWSALMWLHKHDILHRDIRWDNIVLYGTRAVIVDYGGGIDLGELAGDATDYVGGFICCPPRLLGDLQRPYYPKRGDDYHAYVLLVNTLMMPQTVTGVKSGNVASATRMLQEMWRRLRENELWRRYILAAEQEDTATLARLPYLFDGLE